MSLLARLDAALLRRHERNCPWPTTSGAVTTRGPRVRKWQIEENGSMTEITKGAKMALTARDMSGSAYCIDCGVRAVHERGPGSPLVIRHISDCPTWAPNPPSSDSQPLAADSGTELRPCDSVAPTTEDVANLMERQLAVLRERDAARVERDDLRTRLAERDASIVRLMRRIEEEG